MTQTEPHTASSRTLSLPVPLAPAQICVKSTELLRGQKAVDIEHNGATYKLQATRLGKLILTK